MITVSIETLVDRLQELKEFFPLHYRELALDQDFVPLDPQYDEYLRRDGRGEVLLAIARSSGSIVGYFVGFIAPGLHYKTCLTLTGDIFWVHPRFRREGVGVQLFKCVEDEAKRRGVQRMFVGSKIEAEKDCAFLFNKLGYTEVERYWSCWLGERPS